MSQETLHTIAVIIVKPGFSEQFIDLVKGIREETRREEGCISYRLFQDKAVPGKFVFVEEWASEEAFEMHMSSDHIRRITPEMIDMLERDIVIYKNKIIF